MGLLKLSRTSLYAGLISLVVLGLFAYAVPENQDNESLLSTSSLFGNASAKTDAPVRKAATVIPQNADHRLYNNVYTNILDREYCSPNGVGRAMKVVAHGDLTFVLDTGYKTIHSFDAECNHVQSYGSGEGHGPGELLYPTDFALSDEHIWIADSRQRAISKFTINGTFVKRFETPRHPMRVVRSNADLAIMQLGTSDLIQRVNEDGETTATFTHPMSVSGVESPDIPTMGMAEYGDFARAPNGNIIFAPTLASYVFEYTPEGEIVRAFQTIDQFSFPAPAKESTNGSVRYIAPSRDIKVDDVMVDDEFVYIHTRVKQSDAGYWESIVDIYDRSTGIYNGSRKLDQGVKSLHQSQNEGGAIRYVAARDTSVLIFSP